MAKATKVINRSAPAVNNGVRNYTVGYVPNGGKRLPSPSINLGGKWLAECGFLTGQTVSVTASPGRLIVRLVKAC